MMDDPREFDDEASEALVSGRGQDVDAELAGLIAEIESSFTSQLPAAGPVLASIIDDPGVLASASRQLTSRPWFASATRRFVAAATIAFGVTSGLAVADALPGPVQNVMAKVGIGDAEESASPDAGEPGDDPNSTTTQSEDQVGGSSSITLPGATTKTAPTPANHGSEVNGVARDKQLQGCEHGRAVSGVASGKVNPKPCPSTSTTSTTVPGDQLGPDGPGNNNGNGNPNPGQPGGTSVDHGRDGTLPNEDGNNNGTGNPIGRVNGQSVPPTTTP
jgi:hypothetical protein